jgi:hypothetical protein
METGLDSSWRICGRVYILVYLETLLARFLLLTVLMNWNKGKKTRQEKLFFLTING